MSIVGKILIDKFKINIPIKLLEEIGIDVAVQKQKFKDVLADYFCDKNAYSVTIRYGYLKITLTLTRFKPNDNCVYTDTNLEMPSEKWLLNLFNELGFNKNRRLDESAEITWIHLTKNIITEFLPLCYIEFLSKFPLKKRFIASLISSNGKNTSLRLSTPKRNTIKNDIRGDRMFLFYDKTQELQDKAKKYIITPKEPLTDKELEYLTMHGAYRISNNHHINISNLNLLRCELQYKYKEKISALQKFLNPKSETTSLTMSTILNLLSRNELYAKLEQFYTKELQAVVFYKEPNVETEKLTSYQSAFKDLLKETDITTLELAYDAFGLKKLFKTNINNIMKSIHDDLYNELYRKFINNEIS